MNDKGTFKDNTYHTLKFFYLERGHGNSNLKLKYNLVDIPASTMTKVDQLGNPITGAEFALFASDKNYMVTDRNPIATGTTAENGTFTFLNGNGVPLNFKQLNAEGTSYYVLRGQRPRRAIVAVPMRICILSRARTAPWASCCRRTIGSPAYMRARRRSSLLRAIR